MSGRGRGYQGRGTYRGGRGRTSTTGRSGRTTTEKVKSSSDTSSSTPELKFVPQYSGKQQVVMHDTVCDHIINLVQKTYKHGNDIAKALRIDVDAMVLDEGEPEREIIIVPEEVLTNTQTFQLQLEQNGYDIIFKEKLLM